LGPDQLGVVNCQTGRASNPLRNSGSSRSSLRPPQRPRPAGLLAGPRNGAGPLALSRGKVAEFTRTPPVPSASRQVGQPCSRHGRPEPHDPAQDHQLLPSPFSPSRRRSDESNASRRAITVATPVEMGPGPGSGAESPPARTPAEHDPGDPRPLHPRKRSFNGGCKQRWHRPPLCCGHGPRPRG